MSDILCGNIAGDEPPGAPGEWQIRVMQFSNGSRGPYLLYGCPRGRGTCGVPIKPSPPNARGASWTWDGETKAPTLTPSINCLAVDHDGTPAGGCGFHGYMRKGILA